MKRRRFALRSMVFIWAAAASLHAPAAARAGFSAAVGYSAGSQIQDVLTGDFNGDWIPDIAALNTQSSGFVRILPGLGDGTFGSGVAISMSGFPLGVALGDVNGDGNLDLAAARASSNSVGILLGRGDLTFISSDFVAGNLTQDAVLSDFNGDGALDLICAMDGGTGLSAMGNGDGSFQSPATIPLPGGALALGAADFNGDGNRDFATANFTPNTVSVLLGNGDGTFAAAASYAAGTHPYDLVPADFNGDGKPDLANVNRDADTLSIHLNNGDGSFAASSALAVGNQPVNIVAADFDGDGRMDLAAANNGSRTISVLAGNGDGTFQSAVSHGAFASSPNGLAAGDLDGDGHPDLVAGLNSGSAIQVLLNDAPGTLETHSASAFTFQGRLASGGSAATVPHDFKFTLYDAVSGGNPLGSAIAKDDVDVANGLFTALLDFGSDAFDGSPLWMEIEVRTGTDTGAYTKLAPRRQLTISPYAGRALTASASIDSERLGGLGSSAFLGKAAYDADEDGAVDSAENAGLLDNKDSADFLDKGTYDSGGNGRADLADYADNAGAAANSDKLDNKDSGDFLEMATYDPDRDNRVNYADWATTAVYALSSGSSFAGDADTLDGLDSTAFLDKTTYDAGNDGKADAANAADTAASATNAADSDTLDGLDSTDFAAATHNHDANYLKLTGGTMTGNLVIGAPATGDAAIQLPTGAVNSTEISDEPGYATATAGSSTIPLPFTSTTLISTSITVPDSGFLLVFAKGTLNASNINSRFLFDVQVDGLSAGSSMFTANPASTTLPFTPVLGMTTVSGGTHSLLLTVDDAAGAGSVTLDNLRLGAVFIGTGY